MKGGEYAAVINAHGAMRKIIAACILFLLAGPAMAAGAAERADAILLNMLGAVSAVRDYEATFVVQTRVAGQMRRPETILIRQRRQPSCLYSKWLDGARASAERIFCSDEPQDTGMVRRRARTLMNQRELSRAQVEALQVVLRPVDDDGLYGMVARYATQYFDAAQNAGADDFIVELRKATVFDRPASCLRVRRRHPIVDAPFQGQTEMCVDDQGKLPSAFKAWDASGNLLESYLIGNYSINIGLKDGDFELGAGDN